MSNNLNAPELAFPGFLKNWRQRRRLSQLELSLQAGMSQRHVSFLETGRSNPSRFAIAQLAEALEMPAAEVDAMLLSPGYAPFPAVSIDRIWNLVKANAPA